jgi:hypothetical protein
MIWRFIDHLEAPSTTIAKPSSHTSCNQVSQDFDDKLYPNSFELYEA